MIAAHIDDAARPCAAPSCLASAAPQLPCCAECWRLVPGRLRARWVVTLTIAWDAARHGTIADARGWQRDLLAAEREVGIAAEGRAPTLTDGYTGPLLFGACA